ncbi:hypothetical protein N7492_009459 [Penicillium capsulatum]|uniref:Tafazzin n=1 Tax=Penicillium capsulatum TaxID=69766 RepID=A0A9W9LGW1_9EURO|nr:hypothetical protein N7492_009459 [Penicillium capsulatum]KAJ6106849.1 hypothetical protein N7512_010366 [Penicillium capsulatum]
MPKKRTRTFIARPAHTAHHTLSSGVRDSDRYRPTASSSEASVNDLISHLRRTQVSSSAVDSYAPGSCHAFTSARSVPPSLRSVLDLPATQTPRSRPNAPPRTVLGVRPRRPTPGPPPPESWLSPGSNDSALSDDSALSSKDAQKIIYRLQRLPDVVSPIFPEEQSLQHAVLKSMASNFTWHIEYDGVFLTELPWHARALLLSYVAAFGREEPLDKGAMGLRLLFPTQAEYAELTRDQPELTSDGFSDASSLITRLDLGGAMGNWLSFRQLTHELFVSAKSETTASASPPQSHIPDSWDQWDETAIKATQQRTASVIPRSMNEGLRFANLRFLSLAHPNQNRVTWDSLLRLLSRLSTITHLSLAHWPAPFRGPAHHRPAKLTLSAETSAILRQFSRQTYCLKWLDLEGCSEWISALTWADSTSQSDSSRLGSTGPEWNGAWRDIEWINLAPGWNIVDMAAWRSRPLELPINRKTGISRPDVKTGPLSVPVYSVPEDLDDGGYLDHGAEQVPGLQQQAFIRYQKTAESWHKQLCQAQNTYAEILHIRGPRGKRIEALTGVEGLDMEKVSRFILGTAPLAEEYLRKHLEQARAE